MHPQLQRIINKISDRPLRQMVTAFVEDPTIEIEGKTYKGLPLETSPAGATHHHSYPGGLVEHIIATTSIGLALCDVVGKVYHGKINKDLVLAGTILHDITKALTYVQEENGTYRMAPIAERLDHLTLGVAELIRRGFPLDVVHIVDSHMGWQHGPIGPRTAEALVVHLADMADSRLNGEVLRAAQYLLREATGTELSRITAKEAFEIVYAKTRKGWNDVPKALEKIRKLRQQTSHDISKSRRSL